MAMNVKNYPTERKEGRLTTAALCNDGWRASYQA